MTMWGLRQSIGCGVVAVSVVLSACSNNDGPDKPATNYLQLQSELEQRDVREGDTLGLQAQVEAGQVKSGQWQQIAGPTALRLSSTTTNLGIRAPDTRQVVTLSFIYRATGVNGREAEQQHDVRVSPRRQDRVLLGPVADARINAYLLSNLTTPIASSNSSNGADAGYFNLAISGLSDQTWLLLVADGGKDTDSNDDGRPDSIATDNLGQIHALVQVSDLNTGIRIGPISDVVWQLVRSAVNDIPPGELRANLDDIASALLVDLASVDYSSALQFSMYNPVLVNALQPLAADEIAQIARDILQGKDDQARLDRLLSKVPQLALIPPSIELNPVFYARLGLEHRLEAKVSQVAGSVQSILWEQLEGTELNLAKANTDKPILKVPDNFPEQELRYQVTARNEQGLQTVAELSVLISAGNLPPSVNLGADRIVDEQVLVELLPQAFDLDGEIKTVSWQQLAGPSVEIQPTTLQQSFTTPVTTQTVEIRLLLQAVDDEGGLATDELVLTVRPVNQAPQIKLPSTRSVVERRRVLLFPQVADLDGSIASFSWTQTAGQPVELLQADLESLQFWAPSTDSELALSFRLSVEDNEGATAVANIDIAIRDQTSNEPPVIDMPLSLDVPAGTSFVRELTATDPDGDRIEFTLANSPDWLQTDERGQLTGQVPWRFLGQEWQLQLRASDGEYRVSQPLTLRFTQSSPNEQVLFRFLQQTTFGPRPQDLAEVQQIGLGNWLNQQLAMPLPEADPNDAFVSQLQRTEEIAAHLYPQAEWQAAGLFAANANNFGDEIQMSAWIEQALQGEDQLRLRVAYALSQIVVTSTGEPPLNSRSEGLADYFDILIHHAFGNYRDLLGEVARSPAMGIYLSHQGNKKFNEANNTHPDENFARELMQLFSIGLYQLNLDGSGQRNAQGQLIPSYTQDDIEEAARVMTGWDLRGNQHYGSNSPDDGIFTLPMEFTEEHHDFGEKTLLGQVIPADLSGDEDLDAALDILFQHPNVAPFVARLMIQRMVTSNPSPGYIERVALAFESNRLGVRGDMTTVIRAILLDEEARDPDLVADFKYGKLNEPFLAFTAFLRAFQVEPLDGWRINSDDELSEEAQGIYWFNGQHFLGQGPLRSRSVFNFYSPDFVPQQSYFADGNLVAPELQIRTPGNLTATHFLFQNVYEYNQILSDYGGLQNFAQQDRGWQWDGFVGVVNFNSLLNSFEQAMEGDANGDFSQIKSDESDELGWVPKQRGILATVDQLSHRLTGRAASPSVAQAFAQELLSYSHNKNTPATQEALDTVQAAALYFATSARHMVQK